MTAILNRIKLKIMKNDTYKGLVAALLIMLFIIAILPVSISAAPPRIVAWGAANSSGDGVRIRSGPGLSYDVLTHAKQGDAIVILERTNNEWYYVNYNGTDGYVSVALLDRPRTVADFNANGKVTSNGVNMRERPDISSASLGVYAQDTAMSIIGLNEGWYKVRFNDKTGYIRSDLMAVTSLGTVAADNPGPGWPVPADAITGKLTGSKINMRERPGTSSNILGTYAIGTIVEVLGVDNGWYKVNYNGSVGYMHSNYVQVSSTPPNIAGYTGTNTTPPASVQKSSSYVEPVETPPAYNASLSQKIVDMAISLLGSKYVYGGASPSGFDCSGFTYYIYQQHGITITRNSSGQYRDNGTHIRIADLLPGDLVFTSGNGNSVSHVGIYIGENKFIHAQTSSTGVVISDIGTGNYSTKIFGVKRIA